MHSSHLIESVLQICPLTSFTPIANEPAAPQQSQQWPGQQAQLSVLSIDDNDKLVAVIPIPSNGQCPLPSLASWLVRWQWPSTAPAFSDDYNTQSHCMDTNASTLASMYAFIFQLLSFIFLSPHPMTMTTVAPPSVTFPDNHCNDPLALTSFKAMWTAPQLFSTMMATAPASPNDITMMISSPGLMMSPAIPAFTQQQQSSVPALIFAFSCPVI